ncbi:MAG: PAS domain S-box protein [Actinobacteria bacterium]|nr:MAG: PAS domain S-box protein [Actinomycetota bacterium]
MACWAWRTSGSSWAGVGIRMTGPQHPSGFEPGFEPVAIRSCDGISTASRRHSDASPPVAFQAPFGLAGTPFAFLMPTLAIRIESALGLSDMSTTRTRLWWGIATGIAIFAFTRTLMPLVLHPSGAVALWIPSGIAAAAIIAIGPTVLPFVFLGSIAGAIMIAPPAMALGMALIGVTGPLALWFVLRKTRGPSFKLATLSDAFAFGFAAVAASLVPALLGSGTLVALGMNAVPFPEAVIMWWLAETSAVLAIAPVALVWARHEDSPPAAPDAVAALLVTLGVAYFANAFALSEPLERIAPFALMPTFTWIAYRGGRRCMAIAVASVSMISTVGTLRGLGPFASAVPHESVIALNLVISVFSISSLMLVLLFEERSRLAAAAERGRAEMERRVDERTVELTRANESLLQQIAERRSAEQQLAERELSFRLLYERAPLAYQSLDVDGSFLDVNDAWLDLFGYKREEILGTWFGDVLEEGQARVFAERFVGFKVTGSVEGAQFSVRCKDGSHRQVAVYGRIAHSEDGSIHRTHCILQDITRLNAEVDALRASREHFASLFENSHTIMVLVDPETARFVDVNAAACDFFGYAHDEFLEKTIADLNGVEIPEMVSRLAKTAAGPGGIRQNRQRLASGEIRDMEIHAGPIDVNGQRLVFATMQDISDRIAAERELAGNRERLSEMVSERTAELERAYRELEAASAVKDQFMANMSHELRTPLNSIIGFSDMLLSGLVGSLDAEQQRQVGMINTSGKHLLELVNDVLDLARIESGSVKLEPEEFELAPLLDSVIESLRPAAAAKRLDVRVEQSTPMSVVRSDRRKVRQILLNLVGNAVKFTDEGGVVLRVTCDGRETVQFAVSDTGVGIPRKELSEVFSEFHQVAPHDEAKPSGTGLGLAISLRLARILGGDLVVESALGEGSTFTFTLPAAVDCETTVAR